MLKKYLVNMFNVIGIGIDVPTIDKMLLSGRYGNPKSDAFTLISEFSSSTVNFGGIPKIVSVLEAIKNAIRQAKLFIESDVVNNISNGLEKRFILENKEDSEPDNID